MGAAGSDGETAVRRSFGRRKAAAPAMKKKKVPQRGMGMEKLEQHRIQQEWNKINHQPLPLPDPNPYYNNLGGFYPHIMAFPNPDLKLQFGGISNHSGTGLLSKHLSSNPNSVSQHCNACHKKKKLNSRNLGSEQICEVGESCGFLGMNFGDNIQNNNIIISKEENQGLGGKGGEMVGIHRKASSMVMEYDFFPSSNKTKVDDGLVMMTSSPISPNWQLDLSLKLSN